MNTMEAELSAAEKRAMGLPKASRERWLECESTHRFYSFIGKELVACHFLFGKPSAINSYVCKDIDLVVGRGLRSRWLDLQGNESFVGQDPVELIESCFLYHAGFGTFQTYEHRGKMKHRFSMLYKTPKNPDLRTEGKIHLLERAVFDQIVAKASCED